MFEVKHKETGERKTVYHVSGCFFMFWDTGENCWVFDDIANYKPVF